MATTTMRLGLLLILAVAIIQISKGEKEDESQMEQKSEGNMMASSMEEVELRTVREAGKNKQKKCGIKCRRKGGSNKKRRCNKKKCKRERKNNKKGKKKGSKKRTRKTKPTKKGKKGKKQGKKGKEGKEDLKKKKRTKKFKKNPNISVRQTCDEAALCQKIKDYIKYSNQLRKVKRIVKSCDTMEKKANKSATEFDATVAALDEVIASNAKRRLYIRWRRTQRSTDEVVAIRDNLKNCSVSAKAKCEKKVEPACLETALHTECEASLQAWLNSFGPSKGSCLQASADCCACITALPTVDAKCLDFDTKSTNAVASKKKCTGGTETGSFGFCRKQQQEASVKGPPAACGGSTATKAPPSATTAAGATTAAPAGCRQSPSLEYAALNEFFSSITTKYETYTTFTNSIQKMRYIESDLVDHTIDKKKPEDADYNIVFPNGSTAIEKLIVELSTHFQTINNQNELDVKHNDILKEINDQLQCDLVHASSTISKIIKPEVIGGKDMLIKLWNAVRQGTSLNPDIFPNCSTNYKNILWNNTFDGIIKGCNNASVGCINGTIGGAADGLLLIGRQMNNCPLCDHCLIPPAREGDPCFSGSGKVETTTGLKNISELVLGDYVRTSTDNANTYFTEFIGWLVRSPVSPVEMLEIFTSQRSSSLTLTASHIVFTSISTKYADELLPGDSLVYWNGSQVVDEIVTEIRRTVETGFWSPLTRDGTLFVDGYLASCYASFPHKLSDLAMTPVKAMPTILLDDEESQHKDGVRSVVKMMKKLGGWIGARERNLETKELPCTPFHEGPHLNLYSDKSEF